MPSSDPLRIAYLDHRLIAPGRTFVHSEIRALRGLGHEVAAYTVRGSATDGDFDGHRLLDAGPLGLLRALLDHARTHPRRLLGALQLAARTSTPGLHGRARTLFHLLLAAELAHRLRVDRVDHLHNHSITSAAVALLASRLSGVPYSFTTHGPPEFDPPAHPRFDVHAEHAAFIVTISRVLQAELYRHVPTDKWDIIHVVRCGLEPEFLDQAPLPLVDTPELVCVARLNARKGHMLLLEVVARLNDDGVPIRLTLVGDGDLRPRIEATIRHRALDDKVELTGWEDAAGVRRRLAGARALVLPSFSEGLPVSVMEAFALGRPVVATAVGATGELVENGVTGWLVAPADVDALHAALTSVLNTPMGTLAAMGRAGAERVRERHDARREAQRLEALIRAAA
jgi:glycosyltransferase involved in cell wall biosynthesis